MSIEDGGRQSQKPADEKLVEAVEDFNKKALDPKVSDKDFEAAQTTLQKEIDKRK